MIKPKIKGSIYLGLCNKINKKKEKKRKIQESSRKTRPASINIFNQSL